MTEANGNSWRSYLPLIVTIALSVAPLLFVGGRLVNRVDTLESSVRERGTEINERFDQLVDISNARWQARDRQAESGDMRIRALAEALIAQQRDAIAAAGTNSRQDEAIQQALARMERLIERLNLMERSVRPYPEGPQQRGHQ